jgi:hypothetical protein
MSTSAVMTEATSAFIGTIRQQLYQEIKAELVNKATCCNKCDSNLVGGIAIGMAVFGCGMLAACMMVEFRRYH